MEKLPAASGWAWVKQGFAIFRKQPAEISTLFVLYIILSSMLTLIPFVGPILRMMLLPTFSMAFMQASFDVQRGTRVFPKVLFVGFRMPAFKLLVVSGVLYLLAILIAVFAANIVSDGVFWQLFNSPDAPDEKVLQSSGMASAMLVMFLVYGAISVLLWFVAPLIAWQNMSVGKAVFFSFFAVVRASKAFAVYIAAWAGIFIIVFSAVASVLELVIGKPDPILLLPFVILLTTIAQCTVYPSYEQIFGAPQLPEKT